MVGSFLVIAARQERDQALVRSGLGGLGAEWSPGANALPLQSFDGRPAEVVTAALLYAVP
jgi:hypothetical protein